MPKAPDGYIEGMLGFAQEQIHLYQDRKYSQTPSVLALLSVHEGTQSIFPNTLIRLYSQLLNAGVPLTVILGLNDGFQGLDNYSAIESLGVSVLHVQDDGEVTATTTRDDTLAPRLFVLHQRARQDGFKTGKLGMLAEEVAFIKRGGISSVLPDTTLLLDAESEFSPNLPTKLLQHRPQGITVAVCRSAVMTSDQDGLLRPDFSVPIYFSFERHNAIHRGKFMKERRGLTGAGWISATPVALALLETVAKYLPATTAEDSAVGRIANRLDIPLYLDHDLTVINSVFPLKDVAKWRATIKRWAYGSKSLNEFFGSRPSYDNLSVSEQLMSLASLPLSIVTMLYKSLLYGDGDTSENLFPLAVSQLSQVNKIRREIGELEAYDVTDEMRSQAW